MAAEVLERPLPKPTDERYVEARLLEALVEARLALRFLQKGLTRNAAGKAFQAWKALLAALLRLELERLKALAKTEEKRWLESTAAPRVPITKMKRLAMMLEETGYETVSAWTEALNLHYYQHRGPDPDMALSKYTTRGETAADVAKLMARLTQPVKTLKTGLRRAEKFAETLEELQKRLPAR